MQFPSDFEETKKRKHKKKKKEKEEDEKMKKLREERRRRENEEKEKTRKFLREQKAKREGREVTPEKKKEDKKQKYNSQFNPDLARQNLWHFGVNKAFFWREKCQFLAKNTALEWIFTLKNVGIATKCLQMQKKYAVLFEVVEFAQNLHW